MFMELTGKIFPCPGQIIHPKWVTQFQLYWFPWLYQKYTLVPSNISSLLPALPPDIPMVHIPSLHSGFYSNLILQNFPWSSYLKQSSLLTFTNICETYEINPAFNFVFKYTCTLVAPNKKLPSLLPLFYFIFSPYIL